MKLFRIKPTSYVLGRHDAVIPALRHEARPDEDLFFDERGCLFCYSQGPLTGLASVEEIPNPTPEEIAEANRNLAIWNRHRKLFGFSWEGKA